MDFILLAAILIGSGIGIKGLFNKRLLRDLFAYFILWVLGTTGIMLYRFDIAVPNPMDGITYIYQPLITLWKQWF